MGILHLTLHRKWFDLIAAGKKNIEYRRDTPYWHKRIFNKDGSQKHFDEIHFRNGYGRTKPLIVAGFMGAFVTHATCCNPLSGEEIEGLIICILIGPKKRFENYSSESK